MRRIIDIAHGQWLYRNFTLHNKTNGHLLLQQCNEVLSLITQLADSNPQEIPEESKFLLEMNPFNLDTASMVQQAYWATADGDKLDALDFTPLLGSFIGLPLLMHNKSIYIAPGADPGSF